MISITLIGLPELLARLAAFPEALHALVLAKSQDLALQIADKVKNDKLDGQVLASKSGRLRNSIDSNVESSGEAVNGSVFVAGNVPYAAIQEYGGSTKAHVIEATNGKALAFSWQGKSAFFKRINHPGSVIPERSYLRSSLNEMEENIVAGMTDALNEAIENI